MFESKMKNELLKQEGAAGVEGEVAQLRKMVESEDRRARSLMRWAIGAWFLFFAMAAVSIGLPMVMAQLSYSNPPVSVQPSTNDTRVAPTQPVTASSRHIIATIVGVIIMVFFFALPVIAVTLTIMAILARRTAGRRQILAALAGIDAQLRELSATRAFVGGGAT